jgi:hypothetical protein
LDHRELVRNLIKAFSDRIGAVHQDKTQCVLTEKEAHSLVHDFPVPVCLEAITSTSKVVRDKCSMPHADLLLVARKVATRILTEGQSRGLYSTWKYKPTVQSAPAPKPIPAPVAIGIDKLRQEFQDNCTNSGDWTLTEEDVTSLLRQYDATIVRDAFKELGRFDSDYKSQERCFASLQELLDSLSWKSATREFMH